MVRIGSLLLATVLLQGVVASAGADPVTLVTLGDSLTLGDGDEVGGGYSSRLLKKLSKQARGSTLKNLAQSGWTSGDLINTQLGPDVATLKGTGASLYIARLDDQSKRSVMRNSQLRRNSYDTITADDVSRMSVQTGSYNAVIRELAAGSGAATVDFLDTKIFETPATLSEDGNHPNGAGYEAIAGIWYQAISEAVAP